MTIELQFDDSQVKELLNAVVRNMTNQLFSNNQATSF
jgi:hypothetical protein